MAVRNFGVEEELLLVAEDSGAPLALADAVISQGSGDSRESGDAPESELKRQQVEMATAPCATPEELAAELRTRRQAAATAARRTGAAVAALATSPLAAPPEVMPDARYQWMSREYALTAEEQLTCGCHVHVSVGSEQEGVAVLDRIRPWLPTLLALTANSPFWHGRDSGYASYRHQMWGRWPSSGPTEVFGTPEAYHDTVRDMVGSGVLLDEGMVYFDARLSRRYPTVEIRIADICLLADDAVLLALLVRGLVETAAGAWRAGEPPPAVRTELLRLASWRASRSGLDGDLIHPVAVRPAAADVVVAALLDHLAPALTATGDLGTATTMLDRLSRRGNGAALQRRVHAETGDLADVVRAAVTATLDG
ncbi:MAG TPA: glutamate--cysteine ligase [Streptosporangiaceae bacterium]|nr:glutamate--cysteine ligase [Streptosporangiaceae bacterium]